MLFGDLAFTAPAVAQSVRRNRLLIPRWYINYCKTPRLGEHVLRNLCRLKQIAPVVFIRGNYSCPSITRKPSHETRICHVQ